MSGSGLQRANSPTQKAGKKPAASVSKAAQAGKGPEVGGKGGPAKHSTPTRGASPKALLARSPKGHPAHAAAVSTSSSAAQSSDSDAAARAQAVSHMRPASSTHESTQGSGQGTDESTLQRQQGPAGTIPSVVLAPKVQTLAQATNQASRPLPAAAAPSVGAACDGRHIPVPAIVASLSAPAGSMAVHAPVRPVQAAPIAPGAGATGIKPFPACVPPPAIKAPTVPRAGQPTGQARLTAQQNKGPGTIPPIATAATTHSGTGIAPAIGNVVNKGAQGVSGGPGVPTALGARGLLLQQVLQMTANAASVIQARAAQASTSQAMVSATPTPLLTQGAGQGPVDSRTGAAPVQNTLAEEARQRVAQPSSNVSRPVLQPALVSVSQGTEGDGGVSVHSQAAMGSGLASAGSSTQEAVGQMQAMRLQSAESPRPFVHTSSSQGPTLSTTTGSGPSTGRPPSLRPAPQPSIKSQGVTRGTVTPIAGKAECSRGKGPLAAPRGQAASSVLPTVTAATQTSPRSLVRAGGAVLPQRRAKVAAAVLYRIPIRADAATPDIQVSPSKVIVVEDSFYEAGQEPQWLRHAARPYGMGRQMPPYAEGEEQEEQDAEDIDMMGGQDAEYMPGPRSQRGIRTTVLTRGRGPPTGMVGPAGHSWPGAVPTAAGAQAGRAGRGRQHAMRGGRGPRIGWPVPSRRLPVRAAAQGRARPYDDMTPMSDRGEGEGGTNGYDSTHSYGSASASQRQQRLDMGGASSEEGMEGTPGMGSEGEGDSDGADSMDRLWGRRTRPRQAEGEDTQVHSDAARGTQSHEQPRVEVDPSLHPLLAEGPGKPLTGLFAGLSATEEEEADHPMPVSASLQPALWMDAAPRTVSRAELPSGLNYPFGSAQGLGVSPSSGLGKVPGSSAVAPSPYQVSTPTSNSTAAKSLSDLTASLGLMPQPAGGPSQTAAAYPPTHSQPPLVLTTSTGTGAGAAGLGTPELEGLGDQAHQVHTLPPPPFNIAASIASAGGRPLPRAPGAGLRKALMKGRADNSLRVTSKSSSTGAQLTATPSTES